MTDAQPTIVVTAIASGIPALAASEATLVTSMRIITEKPAA